MPFPAERVVPIIRFLEDHGVPVWLDGGWGIDALLEKQTREHLDLDLVIPDPNLKVAESLLATLGFARDDYETNMPLRLALRSPEGLAMDILLIVFNPDGSARHADDFIYSPAGLAGFGRIDGQIVRCISAADQARQRIERDYSPFNVDRIRADGLSKDLEDVKLLQERFKIKVPESLFIDPRVTAGGKKMTVIERLKKVVARSTANGRPNSH